MDPSAIPHYSFLRFSTHYHDFTPCLDMFVPENSGDNDDSEEEVRPEFQVEKLADEAFLIRITCWALEISKVVPAIPESSRRVYRIEMVFELHQEEVKTY